MIPTKNTTMNTERPIFMSYNTITEQTEQEYIASDIQSIDQKLDH